MSVNINMNYYGYGSTSKYIVNTVPLWYSLYTYMYI